MMHIVYGIWDGKVYDNRDKKSADISDLDVLKNVEFFNEGNAVKAFFGDKGFLVFDASVNLLDALWRHMRKTAVESCGKCTPCRMGSRLLVDALNELRNGRGTEQTWVDLYEFASQMKKTALCGVGRTGAVALIGALENFRDKLEEDASESKEIEQHGISYITAPCIEACPSKINVPRYIDYIRDGKPVHALGVILQKYPLAATCGRVCVRFCEQACRRNLVDDAVGIKLLKRYAADYQDALTFPEMFDKKMCAAPIASPAPKVAVIGAGPSGVTCAYHLLFKGHDVDVFEANAENGGMTMTGIPSYRLPKDIVNAEVEIVKKLGGNFFYNQALGKDFTVDDLFKKGYKSVYISIGCSKGAFLGLKNENTELDGYMTGVDFLNKSHKHAEGGDNFSVSGKVVVVGGGNVAMDCARSALRLGADEVHLVYRRTKEDMPADHEEVLAAEREGIIFDFLTNPSAVVSKDGKKLSGIELVDMKQTEPDASGRRGVDAIEGSEHEFSCDMVIAAIGQQMDEGVMASASDVVINRGRVTIEDSVQATSRQGVFAGGDCARGPATLIHAMADGMNAAYSIDDYLRYGKVRFSPLTRVRQIIRENKLLDSKCIEVPVIQKERVNFRELYPDERKKVFDEVDQNVTAEEAYNEAKRCMRCFRVYSVITAEKVMGDMEEHLEKYDRSIAKDC